MKPGRATKRKGSRVEREIVKKLVDAGVPAKKVPLSGQIKDYKGDIHIMDVYLGEVKARKNGNGFKTMETWLKGNQFLILKRDYANPFVAMEWDMFVELLYNIKGKYCIETDLENNNEESIDKDTDVVIK